MARAETGRLSLAAARADLMALVDEVVAEHRFTVESRRPSMSVRGPEQLACRIDTQKSPSGDDGSSREGR